MPSPILEITGVYLNEKPRTRKPGSAWAVHSIRVTVSTDERLAVGLVYEFTGESDSAEEACGEDGSPTYTAPELQTNCEYRFYGRIVEREFRGIASTQFQFSTFVRAIPHARESVIRYLQEAPHIGPRIAATLFEKFGADAVRILRETPEVAAVASNRRLTIPQAEAAAVYLRELAALEAVTMEMMDLTAGYGLPKATGRLAIKEWGNNAPRLVRHNPYLLMRFRGVGFLKTDKIYLSLGLPPAKIKRQALAAWYALASDSDGHTWLAGKVARDGIRATVGSVVELAPDKALALAKRKGIVSVCHDVNGVEWATDGRKAAAEERLAGLVLAAMEEAVVDTDGREVAPWQAITDHPQAREALDPLTDHQRDNLTNALRGTIGILGGSPGTGKTFTAAALMKAIVAACGESAVAICAPTGKAAVRCTEAMASYGLNLRAKTIHSLLRVSTADDGSGVWGFEHNERNPLPFQFIIVDESSMIDVPLMAALFAARSRGTAVLLCGDVNQLPPVGHGAPLRDLIAADIPYGELTEIKRNAGTIVRACAAIRDGKPFPVDPFTSVDIDATPPRNLVHIPTPTPQATIDEILAAIRTTREGGKFDPIWGVQVVVAVNAKSPLARKPLNEILQRELNPNGERCEGSPFRVGDKVICTKNSFFKAADEGDWTKATEEEIFVANGEFGAVVGVDPRKTIVHFPSSGKGVRVVIPKGRAEGDERDKEGGGGDSEEKATSTGCNLDLGYAATCHKMQGSQAPIVIVVLDEYPGASGKFGVWKREALYTAISRAEKLCYLVGKMSTAQKIMKERALPLRKTFLAERIREARLFSSRAWWVKESDVQNQTELVTV